MTSQLVTDDVRNAMRGASILRNFALKAISTSLMINSIHGNVHGRSSKKKIDICRASSFGYHLIETLLAWLGAIVLYLRNRVK